MDSNYNSQKNATYNTNNQIIKPTKMMITIDTADRNMDAFPNQAEGLDRDSEQNESKPKIDLSKQVNQEEEDDSELQNMHEDEDSQNNDENPDYIKNFHGEMFIPRSVLILNVKAASKVRKADFIGQSDPYVIVKFDKHPDLQTDTVNNNPNPHWGKKFSLVVEPEDGNKFIELNIYDGNSFKNDEFLGVALLPVKTIFRDSRQNEIELKVFATREENIIAIDNSDNNKNAIKAEGYDSLSPLRSHTSVALKKNGEKEKEQTTITVSWKCYNLLSQETALNKKPANTDSFIQQANDMKALNGVLKIEVHHMQYLNPALNYDLYFQMNGQNNNQVKRAETSLQKLGIQSKSKDENMVTLTKKNNSQVCSDIYFSVQQLLSTEITASLFQNNVKLGEYKFDLFLAADLIQEQSSISKQDSTMTIDFSKFVPIDKNVTLVPHMYATLSYSKSLFTERSIGKLNMMVQNWKINDKQFPQDYFINVQVGGKQYKISRVYHEFIIPTLTPLDKVVISVHQSKLVSISSQIGEHTLRLYELFGSQEHIVFQSSLKGLSFVNSKFSAEIYISLASTYEPNGLTDDERKILLAKSEATKINQPNVDENLEDLLKKKIVNPGDNDIYIDYDAAEGQSPGSPSRFRNEALCEMPQYDVANLPQFSEKPQGLFVLRILNLQINWNAKQNPGLQKFFFIFKTPRMIVKTKAVKGENSFVFGDVICLRTYYISDTIMVYLHSESEPFTALAEAKMSPESLLQKVDGWKREQKKIDFRVLNLKSILPPAKNISANQVQQDPSIQIDVEYQYRYSKFTKIPQGKLTVKFVSGLQIQYQGIGYSPIMEVNINQSTIRIDEKVTPNKAHWKQSLLDFDITSIWDCLEVKFFYKDNDKNIFLLGQFTRPLNTVYFDNQLHKEFNIDLKILNPKLGGFIRLFLEYYPYTEAAEQEQSNLVQPKIKQTDNTSGGSILASSQKKRGICYLTLQKMSLQGPQLNNYENLKNIRIEVSYGQTRYLTRISTDLSMTSHNQIFNDIIRLVFDDHTFSKVPENFIIIRAYDICYNVNSGRAEKQINEKVVESQLNGGFLIGETKIDPTLIRLYQGQDMHLQCAISIKSENIRYIKKQMTDDDEEEELIKQVYLLAGESQHQDPHFQQEPQILLNFTVMFVATNFTQNPVGIITITDLTLLNLENYVKDLNLITHSLYIKFKLNNNKNYAFKAEQMVDKPIIKEKICLFNQEHNPGETLKGGHNYFVRSAGSKCTYQAWPKNQIVLFSSDPQDSIDILLVQVAKNSKGISSEQSAPIKREKAILAHIHVNLSDISYFAENSVIKKISIANLMDFEANRQYNQAKPKNLNLNSAEQDQQMQQSMILRRNTNAKDLLSNFYSKQLILLMDVTFQQGAFLEIDQTKKNKHFQNIFMQTRLEKYNDIIDIEYRKKVQQIQAVKENQASAFSSKTSTLSNVFSNSNSPRKNNIFRPQRMLIEFIIQDVNTILKQVKQRSTIFAFLVFEGLENNDSLQRYMFAVTQQIKNNNFQHKTYENNTLNGQDSIIAAAAAKAEKAFNLKIQMQDHFGANIEDFVSQLEDLLRPDQQVTKIISINSFQVHHINQILEAWVPNITQKIILSLVTQAGERDKLVNFRQQVLNEVLTKEVTLKGLLQQQNMPEVRIYQSVIDLQDCFDVNSVEKSIKKVFSQQTNLAELSVQGPLMQNPTSIANASVKTRVQISQFIDKPSGILNVILKNMTHNSANFNYQYAIELKLKSRIEAQRLLLHSMVIRDKHLTQTLNSYKLRTLKNNKVSIGLNEVSNFVARHYCDLLVISLYNVQKNNEGLLEAVGYPVFSTQITLNDLELNDEKISLMVVGTSQMSKIGPPVYYTFELDLVFKVRLVTDPDQSELEVALQNYRLMKGPNSKQNLVEEQAISILLQRFLLSRSFKVLKKRQRRVLFAVKNMRTASYSSVDMNKLIFFRVSPKTFLMDVDDYSLSQTAQQYQDKLKNLAKELKFGVQQIDTSKYKGLSLCSNPSNLSANMLTIEFVTALTSLNAKSKLNYKKLTVVVNQDSSTEYKLEYNQLDQLEQVVLQNTKLIFKNVKPETVLSLRLIVEENSTSPSKKQSMASTIGMGNILVGSLDLKTWEFKQGDINIGAYRATFNARLLFSDFTKNPRKIVHLSFHRLFCIQSFEMVDNYKELLLTNKLQGKSKLCQENNCKIHQEESPIIYKINERQAAPKVAVQTISHMVKNDLNLPKNKQGNNDNIQREILAKSFNQQFANLDKNQIKQESSSHKYKLVIEYKNCLQNKGVVNDKKVIIVNQYGKANTQDIMKMQINNIDVENEIHFKLCLEAGGGSRVQNSLQSEIPLESIAEGSISLAEIQAVPNQPLNLFVPLHQVVTEKVQTSRSHASGGGIGSLVQAHQNKNYEIKDLYILIQIVLTDLTFGELVVEVEQFSNIPKSQNLREIQWSLKVQSSLPTYPKSIKDLVSPNSTNPKISNKDKNEGIKQQQTSKDLFNFESQAEPYNISLNQQKVDKQLVIFFQLKDVFYDMDQFLKASSLSVHMDKDQYLIFDFLGTDQFNTQAIIGSKKLSLFTIIQNQLLKQIEQQRAQQQQDIQNKNNSKQSSGEGSTLNQESKLDKQMQQEFGDKSSAKFQKMYREMYQQFNQSQSQLKQQVEEEEAEKIKAKLLQQSPSPKKKRQNIPQGYQVVNLRAPKVQEGSIEQLKSFNDIMVEAGGKEEMCIEMIAKLTWDFTFQKRATHSEVYNQAVDELKQVERVRLAKQISNILENLDQVKNNSDLTASNLKTLALVLATESCSGAAAAGDNEAVESNQAIVYMDQIMETIVDIYKNDSCIPQTLTLISMMRCINYLKIICDCNQFYRKKFENLLRDTQLVSVFIDQFKERIKDRSMTFCIEFMIFLANLLTDFNAIYYEVLCGVRLDVILEFITLGPKHFKVMHAYSQFLNAVGQCLFQFESQKSFESPDDAQYIKYSEVVKLDMIKISKCIVSQFNDLIDGLDAYKNDYEVLAESLSKTAFQFIHISIFKHDIVKQDEGNTLPNILLHLFKILIDSMVSQTSLSFVNELKMRLIYEISLINQMNLRQKLFLSFDDGKLVGMLKTAATKFLEIVKVTSDYQKRDYSFQFFEKTKMIFEFFATYNCMNIFAENCRPLIKEILCDKSVMDHDFVLFLLHVIKVDAEYESVNGDAAKNTKERQAKMLNDKYGQVVKTNKFSLSHIEWLENMNL